MCYKRGKEGFELIFSSTDLDNFDGNIELFFKSLQVKLKKIL